MELPASPTAPPTGRATSRRTPRRSRHDRQRSDLIPAPWRGSPLAHDRAPWCPPNARYARRSTSGRAAGTPRAGHLRRTFLLLYALLSRFDVWRCSGASQRVPSYPSRSPPTPKKEDGLHAGSPIRKPLKGGPATGSRLAKPQAASQLVPVSPPAPGTGTLRKLREPVPHFSACTARRSAK